MCSSSFFSGERNVKYKELIMKKREEAMDGMSVEFVQCHLHCISLVKGPSMCDRGRFWYC